MQRAVLALLVAFGCGLLSAPALLQQKGGGDETGVYDVVSGWPQPFARQGYIQGSQYDLNGKLLYSWGTFPGAFWGVHQLSVDANGNLYAAETYGGRTQKYKPKPGADRSKVIGSPIALMTKSTQ